MTRRTGSVWVAFFAVFLVAGLSAGQEGKPAPKVEGEGAKCVTCHRGTTPGIAEQWAGSKHAEAGVTCLECHSADGKDKDAFAHNGVTISTIVSPEDCARCHAEVVLEASKSHHAQAAKFVGSLDNILGEIVEGKLAAVFGCRGCHGSEVAFLKSADGSVRRDDSGKPLLDPATWPNTGIGRINPDGSNGACTACHSRHAFSVRMARQPEVCGRCHLGPDHPQAEIYDESKHGIAYRTREDEMNLASATWVVGKDYSAAPTCATCHMSATRELPVTHDVGDRISWTLRPVVSKKLEDWEVRRADMKKVCRACHAPDFLESFYRSYDDTVDLWNTKFAVPAQSVMDALKAGKKVTPTPFDDEIEWTFYRLWHHEGRRARMGASMQGPDFVQWHGFFEVAENFYTRFLPQAEHLAAGDPAILAAITKVKDDPLHAWRKGLSPEDRAKIEQFYKERYGH